MISRCEAYQHIIRSEPLPRAFTSLNKSLGLAFADKICAVRNYPSIDSSLNDRFAIVTDDRQTHRQQKDWVQVVQNRVQYDNSLKALRTVR